MRVVIVASAGLLMLMALAVMCGATGFVAPLESFHRLSVGETIVAQLRAPRAVLAALVGGSLGLAGAAMQCVTRNPLADPYILGLSGGASLAAVIAVVLFPGAQAGLFGALGAALAAVLVQLLAGGTHDPTRLLLSGVTVGTLLSSATGVVLILAPSGSLLRSAMHWLFGGLGTPTWSGLLVPASCLAAGALWLWARGLRLDRLSLGPDAAASLGVPVAATRRGTLAVAVVLTASAVADSGLVGFVGLLSPHMARRLVGLSHREMLPVCLVLGAGLVVGADILARTMFAPRELPVGLITSAVGGPFFLLQLARRRSA